MSTLEEMHAIGAAIKKHLDRGARVRLTLEKGPPLELEIKWLSQPCSSVGWTELGLGPDGGQSSQSLLLYWDHLSLQDGVFLVNPPPGKDAKVFFQRLPVQQIEVLD